MNKEDIKTITKAIKDREILIEALKKIRDSQENDLGVYASFCENTAREVLEEIISRAAQSNSELSRPR